MDYMILQKLFLDNPELEEELYRFCRDYPGRQEAAQEFQRSAREVEQAMGLSRYMELEERLNRFMAVENKACYLFGLHLRGEVLQSLLAQQSLS